MVSFLTKKKKKFYFSAVKHRQNEEKKKKASKGLLHCMNLKLIVPVFQTSDYQNSS